MSSEWGTVERNLKMLRQKLKEELKQKSTENFKKIASGHP